MRQRRRRRRGHSLCPPRRKEEPEPPLKRSIHNHSGSILLCPTTKSSRNLLSVIVAIFLAATRSFAFVPPRVPCYYNAVSVETNQISVSSTLLRKATATTSFASSSPQNVSSYGRSAKQTATKQPVAAAAAAAAAKDDNEEELQKIRNRRFLERNNHWIVFVDDEADIRQSVGDFLYDSGYQVTACSDATAAVELLSNATTTTTHGIPSCIVSDIRMPGGPDGLELLQWIRTQEDCAASSTLQRVPVVLLTAKGLTQDRIAGYRAGADVYLPKPFYPDELLSVIDNAIARRQQMMGESGSLLDLQDQMASIKTMLMQQNKNNPLQTTMQEDVAYLTPTERELLDLVCRGYTNGEIASERGTSKHVVSKTLKQIYAKSQTKTRTELLRWAIQTGYVNPKL